MNETEKLINQIHGRIRGGRNSIANGTGIWSLSKEKQIENAKKGAKRVAILMKDPAYRKLHSMKVRYGKLKNRFDRQTFMTDY